MSETEHKDSGHDRKSFVSSVPVTLSSEQILELVKEGVEVRKAVDASLGERQKRLPAYSGMRSRF